MQGSALPEERQVQFIDPSNESYGDQLDRRVH